MWLPKLLDGRVFTHRLSASEVAHDILTVTPDLDPITTLCESEQFARFGDGSPARVALSMFDHELLDERAIPLEVVDPLGALLLAPGTLAALGAVEDDVVGLRLTAQGLVIEAVTPAVGTALGTRLSAMLDADEPVYFDAVVSTACADDPALFTQPLAPLSEIAAGAGLPYDDEWIAAAGFDFDVWHFDRGCAALARQYDLNLDDAFALYTLLQMCGFLLPEDERALAEQWLLADRSVFEVEEVHRGQGITVRDVRTGDRHEVSERMGSGVVKPGQLICARTIPAGDTMQFVGGMEPVALHERDALIALLDAEPDPVELVAFLSRRFAPPTLVNTDGDPLAICEATVQVGDPDGIESALDNAYDRLDGEEPPRWLEHVVNKGMPRIRATLVLDGDTLQVETNSEKRMDRVLATLARLDPGMTVLDDTRRPMGDAREAAALATQLPAGSLALDPDDPEVAAFMEQVIHDFEARWLDEQIPALDGYTPRQAADDPTRRPDLIKLLDTFPAGVAAAGSMDADRLRAALGLEQSWH